MEKSYLCRPEFSIPHTTIPDLLDKNAKLYPEKEAFVFTSQSEAGEHGLQRSAYKFKDVSQESTRLASSFLAEGINAGDRIAIYGHPSKAYLQVDFATLRIKVLLLRLPATLVDSDELDDVLVKYRCKMLIIDETALKTGVMNKLVSKQDAGDAFSTHFSLLLMKSSHAHPQMKSLEDLMTIHHERASLIDRVQEIQSTIDPDEGCVVFPTSGTTGMPKFILHSHKAMIFLAYLYKYWYDIGTPGDGTIMFNNRPYAWLASSVHVPVIMGWSLVSSEVNTNMSNLHLFTKILQEESVSAAFFSVQMMHEALTKNLQFGKSLKMVLSAGEAITDSVLNSLLQVIRAVFMGYGCTEAMGASTTGEVEKSGGIFSTAQYTPLPGTEIKITNSDGQAVKPLEPGTIWMRGRMTFCCYLDDPEATRMIVSDSGWVNTRDAGIIHPEGYLQVIGRDSDLISKGSCKVYPITIEKMLLKLEGISCATVMGIPDDYFGEEIGACVVPREGHLVSVEAVEEHCKEHATSVYGLLLSPKYIVVLEELPRLPNGKPDKVKIKDILMGKSPKLQGL